MKMIDNNIPPLQRIYAGTQLSFLVLGRRDVRAVIPEVPYIVISITDPGSPDAEVADSPLRREVLRLKFDDVSEVNIPGLEDIVLEPRVELSEDDVQAIIAFFEMHRHKVELVVCQCEAGVSRSAGIAAALSQIVQGDDAFFFANYYPNVKVYQALLKAAKR